MSEHFDRAEKALEPFRQELLNHTIYKAVSSAKELRIFMEIHCYAVWDFMSLAKRIQQEFTCVEIPWLPNKSPELARFINEVVIGEECDESLGGGNISHVELYLEAMKEIGAKTKNFTTFLQMLRDGIPMVAAMRQAEVPEPAVAFTSKTIELAKNGPLPAVLSSFVFGREDLIPDMFQRFLDESNEKEWPSFCYYLKRHIELDGDEHGPLAIQMLEEVCGTDQELWELATDAGIQAIKNRTKLWDGIYKAISNQSEKI